MSCFSAMKVPAALRVDVRRPNPESIAQTAEPDLLGAAECAVRFEPICANTGFFDTSTTCFRAG
jgi:hypothetical protein